MNNTSNSISPYDFVLVPFSPDLPRGGNPNNPPSVCRACIFFTDKTIKCEAVYTNTFCTGTNIFILQHKVTGLSVPITDLTDQYQRHKDEYPRSSCISVLHSSYKSGDSWSLCENCLMHSTSPYETCLLHYAHGMHGCDQDSIYMLLHKVSKEPLSMKDAAIMYARHKNEHNIPV